MSYYPDFSYVYDILTFNISYKERAKYFESIIKKNSIKGKILVDLGCGTGSLSEEFFNLGYEVIGIDISEDMLSNATEKKSRTNSDILYLKQDISKLDLHGKANIMISALDSINHIISEIDLQNFFNRVALFLSIDGILIFDLNTVYKHREILANNIFTYDLDDVYCVWQNSLLENDIVSINLDIFRKCGSNYERLEDKFYERAYSEAEIKKFIYKSGLYIVDIYNSDSYDKPAVNSERLVYVVKKKGG